MNKLYLLLVFLLSTFMDIQGQVVAVKTNVLYDAITTPNVGAEVAFNKHWSVEASGYYNGWTFSSDKSFKHWVIQPEVRYWIHERFNGHFFGVHAQYMDYDFAGLKLLYGMEKRIVITVTLMAAVSLMVISYTCRPVGTWSSRRVSDTCISNMISTLFLEEMRLSASSATSIGD